MLPGVSGLLKELQEKEIYWVWKEEMVVRGFDDTANVLIITDDMRVAVECQSQRICCIGCQNEESSSYFSGAEAVLYSFEDVTAEYLIDIHHHFHGIPIMIAETERLLIRESCLEDFDVLYQISREQGNERYMETMSENYEEEKEKFQAYVSNVYRYYGLGLWTVIEKTSEEIIGRCGISMVEDGISPDGRTELGYVIKRSHRESGYGREACEAIIEYVSDAYGLNLIYATVHKENIPSQKLAEKLGFEVWKEWDEAQLYVYKLSL